MSTVSSVSVRPELVTVHVNACMCLHMSLFACLCKCCLVTERWFAMPNVAEQQVSFRRLGQVNIVQSSHAP